MGNDEEKKTNDMLTYATFQISKYFKMLQSFVQLYVEHNLIDQDLRDEFF